MYLVTVQGIINLTSGLLACYLKKNHLPLHRSYGQDYPILQYADDTLIIFNILNGEVERNP
jgi:hypothetical protein